MLRNTKASDVCERPTGNLSRRIPFCIVPANTPGEYPPAADLQSTEHEKLKSDNEKICPLCPEPPTIPLDLLYFFKATELRALQQWDTKHVEQSKHKNPMDERYKGLSTKKLSTYC